MSAMGILGVTGSDMGHDSSGLSLSDPLSHCIALVAFVVPPLSKLLHNGQVAVLELLSKPLVMS